MKKDQHELFQLKQILAQEEFRLWDAYRNGCNEASINTIRTSIEKVKATLVALEMIVPQRSLS